MKTLILFELIGNCMQGISDLFGSIFGITFEPVLVDNGEVWHEDVIKVLTILSIGSAKRSKNSNIPASLSLFNCY